MCGHHPLHLRPARSQSKGNSTKSFLFLYPSNPYFTFLIGPKATGQSQSHNMLIVDCNLESNLLELFNKIPISGRTGLQHRPCNSFQDSRHQPKNHSCWGRDWVHVSRVILLFLILFIVILLVLVLVITLVIIFLILIVIFFVLLIFEQQQVF